MALQPLRIAIAGAGPSGLVLASILSREAPRGSLLVDVFERDSRSRDQGAGWDIDAPGRAVLQRAGVDLQRISRPNSDTMRVFRVGERSPCSVMGLPRALARFFPASLETNRHELRENLLEALGENVQVHFECGAGDVVPCGAGGTGAQLLSQCDGSTLGQYHLVVDASGVSSALRRRRVREDGEHRHYTGLCMFHGVIDDPERSCHPEVVRQLGEGTAVWVGERHGGKGASMLLQRYGAQPEDHRTTFGYTVDCECVGELTAHLGLGVDDGKVTLTEAETPVQLHRVREWIKHEELGDHGLWVQHMYGVVDALSSVTVRPLAHFPADPPLHADALPLVCIGDALHALPPYTGSSGNLALRDAGDLADLLLRCARSASAPTNTTGASSASAGASSTASASSDAPCSSAASSSTPSSASPCSPPPEGLVTELREIEQHWLRRAAPIGERGEVSRKMLMKIRTVPGFARDLTVAEMLRGEAWTPTTFVMAGVHRLLMLLHSWENFGMRR
jgi:2-polyprenyl-6-methoxyphenol hydroxylase-like FAD-dependent oxidoreductase